jgi:hypothetical protein
MRGESVEFDTPTSAQWNQGGSLVVAGADIVRPKAWTWQECQEQLKISATRGPRVQLVSKESAAEILQIPLDEIHDWHRAMATLPAAGPEMVRAWTAMLSDPELAPEIKAAICWTTARHNRASSSLAMAKAFADQLKLTEQQIQAWDANDAKKLTPGLVQAIEFAKKLTCDPTKITDADIARLREVFSDRQTAHAIYTAATANAMDRFTETLGLAIHP